MRSRSSSPRPPGRITRRTFAGLIALALPAPALATHTGDGSLARVIDRGRIRIISGQSMTMPIPGSTDNRVSDPFNGAVAELIATELGVALDLVPEREAGRPIPRLLSEDIDVLLAAPVTRLVSTRLLLSRPYAMLDIVIIAPRAPRLRGPQALAGLRIGVLANYLNAYGPTLPLPPEATVIRFDAMRDIEAALREGRIDASLMPGLQARAITGRVAAGTPLAVHFAAASLAFAAGVRFGAHDLLHAVNSTLAEALLHGELPALFRRETGLTLPPLMPL